MTPSETSDIYGDCAEVLDELDRAGVPLRALEIADRLGWGRSRVSRALAQLKRDGCVKHNAAHAVWSVS